MTPTAAKPRVILALLALNVNDVVTVEELVSELWADAVPRSARTTLQGYIVQLRRRVAAALGPPDAARRSKDIVSTTARGYSLRLAEVDTDVRHFEELAQSGHRAHQDGDYRTSARTFAAALDCWRGPALTDVEHGTQLSEAHARLDEARLSALECRIEADLRLGRHRELLGELAGLVARHRLHEGLYAHYMLALYRSGRRCEALTAYRQLCDTLMAEQGLEPTPLLRRLHLSMLEPDRDSARTAERSYTELVGRCRPAVRDARARSRGVLAELAIVPWDAVGPDEVDAR